MVRPVLSAEQIKGLFPEIEAVSTPIQGGQKLVFPCQIGEKQFVLKVLRSDLIGFEETIDVEQSSVDEVYERARREVDILAKSASPHLPKLGPIGLKKVVVDNQSLVIFSEKLIVGEDIHQLIRRGFAFDSSELICLAKGIALAIDELWKFRRIHRDIKPQNIMRGKDGGYILLDPGIAFDLNDISLTADGFVPHTPGYIAPECVVPDHKRDADCRSDFFLLGTVLYVCVYRDGIRLTVPLPYVQRRYSPDSSAPIGGQAAMMASVSWLVTSLISGMPSVNA